MCAGHGPGQVGGHQLPHLAGHHAGHQAQHQRLLPDQRLLLGHELLALGLIVTPVQRHLHHGLGAGYGGHHLAREVDGAEHLHDAAQEKSNAKTHRACAHWSPP